MAPDWKSTPFGPIPSDWGLERVGAAGEVQIGRARSPDTDTGPNMVPYLRVANVLDGNIDYSDVYSMHFSEADQRKYSLRPGDILLNEGQSTELVGRSAIYDGPEGRYCYQNSLVNFRCGPAIVPLFARAIFKRWLDIGHFKTIVKQTTSMAHLGGARFATLVMPTPPMPEQRRIAEILDTLDEAIRNTEQIIAKLKQLKQGLLHDLLTRGIDDNGELRDPIRHPEQFRDSPLGRIPVEWVVSSVDSEFEVTAGIALGPDRRPNRRPWPYLRVANVQRDALELSDVAELEIFPGELADRRLAPGDLLVVEGHANPAEIGRCAMAGDAATGYTFQNHLFQLRSRRMVPEFGLQWMNSTWAQAYWRKECATSSGLNTINRTKLRRLNVLLPPIAEQRAIVERVEACADRLSTPSSH